MVLIRGGDGLGLRQFLVLRLSGLLRFFLGIVIFGFGLCVVVQARKKIFIISLRGRPVRIKYFRRNCPVLVVRFVVIVRLGRFFVSLRLFPDCVLRIKHGIGFGGDRFLDLCLAGRLFSVAAGYLRIIIRRGVFFVADEIPVIFVLDTALFLVYPDIVFGLDG